MTPGDVEHVPVGLGRVLGPEHRRPAGRDVPLELDQQLIEIGDDVLFTPSAAVRQSWK